MIFNQLKFYFYLFIYSKLKHTKLMTQNMKSPNNGFLGNIAKYLMLSFNKFVINDSVKKLNIQSSCLEHCYVKKPIKKNIGKTRPIGRPPKGKTWDFQKGKYV